MATNTTNYSFKKPDESDFYDVQDQNGNWDMADEALKSLDTPTFEDYTGSTPVPAANTAIDGIKSKTKLSALMSNIKAAFKGACLIGHIVNNCVTNNPNLPLSAAQGKVLMDLYTRLNGEFVVSVENLNGTVTSDNADIIEIKVLGFGKCAFLSVSALVTKEVALMGDITIKLNKSLNSKTGFNFCGYSSGTAIIGVASNYDINIRMTGMKMFEGASFLVSGFFIRN